MPDARRFVVGLRKSITSAPSEEALTFSGDGQPSGSETPTGQAMASDQVALYLQADATVPADLWWYTLDGGTTWARLADDATATRYDNGAATWPNVGNGGTAGMLRTSAAASFRVAGTLYQKAATDDLWDLSGQADTAADEYQGFHLYLNASGVASIGAGTIAASEAAAIAALPAVPAAQSVLGVFVAGPSCDFDDAGGLATQGSIFNGWAGAAV